jgi:hypothetical protein
MVSLPPRQVTHDDRGGPASRAFIRRGIALARLARAWSVRFDIGRFLSMIEDELTGKLRPGAAIAFAMKECTA